MPWLDDLPPVPLGARSTEWQEPAPARPDDFNAPVVDFGFHSRDEKPIRPLGDESIFGPAGRQNNIVISAMSRKDAGVDNTRDPDDPDYMAWPDIEAVDRYRNNWSRFVGSNNRRHTEALKRQIDMEADDRRALDAAGWPGMLASMVMSVADPTILLPGGGVVASARGGFSLAKSALVVGTAAGAGAAVQEGFLQASQETRPLEESALNIGGSIILGGLLGAGGAALLNRAERKTVESAARVLYGGTPAAGGPAVAAGGAGGVASAAGAEAVSRPGLADLTIDGRVARTVAEATSNLNPTLRLNTSPLAASREFGQQLAENSLYQGMHSRGETLGPAVETLARANYNSRIFQSVSEHNDLFSEGRKAGLRLSRTEFEEAVGRALRRGDEGENEFVTRAAQSWRKNLFDPFKDEAIAARLLPPDVTPEGAASYFSRVYDRERLIAREADFKGRVTSYYAQVLANEFGTHSDATRSRLAALEAELADLRMAPEQRTAALTDINTALRDLEAKNIDKVDLVDRIQALSKAAREATDKGNRAAAKAAREEITRLKTEGGKDLAGFIKERGGLRSRANRVNMNYAGLAERQNRVMNQLADLEESNIRNMNRLVARGRKFEQEAQRLDPLIRDEKMAELRTAFGQVLQRSEKAAQRIADARAKLAEDAAKDGTNGRKAVANSTGVREPQGRVSEAASGDQGGVRTDPAIGSAVPQGRFGQEASYGGQSLSAKISAPEIKADLGVDIPGTLLRDLQFGKEPPSVTAWHGTPHEFDRFSLDKIGTGEGAQAYGHGLYFAENEAVAKGYKDKLSQFGDVYHGNRKIEIEDGDTVEQFAAATLLGDKTPSRAISTLEGKIEHDRLDAEGEKFYRDTIQYLKDNASQLAVRDNAGSLYQVRIKANPDHFLDWDKPLSGQSAIIEKAFAHIPQAPDIPGKLAYYRLAGELTGNKSISSPEASAALRKAGIVGIRYLDAGSRGNFTVNTFYKGKPYSNPISFPTEAQAREWAAEQVAKGYETKIDSGTSNFVVFDDSLIQIIGKDGKPVPINDAIRGAAIGRMEVSAELRTDLMPPTGLTSDAASIMRAAMDGKPRTIEELEAAIVGAANDMAPEGMRVKQSTLDAFNEAIRDNATGTLAGGKPLSLSQFIARNGGLALDGDALAGGLNKFRVPGYGNVARKTGRSIDGYWREALMEAGYFPKDADGYMSRDITGELYAALDAERAGNKRYSAYDEHRVSAMQDKAKAADARQELEYRAEQNAKVIIDELEAVGIDANQIDMEALNRVAMKMAEGDATNPLDLYERAVMALADEVDEAAIKAADDKLAKDMAKGPKAVRAPSPESIALRQRALDVQLAREEKLEKSRIEKLNGLARRMETLDAFNPEERMFELRRIMDELARTVSDSSLAKGEKAAALKDRYKQFDPERVKAREDQIAAMKADAERAFYDRWEGRAMGEGVDLAKGADARFDAMARQIADDVFDKITGKSTGAVSAPEFITPLTSGPLKERTFNVPDKLIEEFLDSNVISVGERYGRSMASQIEMTNRFGRADMVDQIDQIRTGYMVLRDGVNAAQTGEEAAAVIGRTPGALDSLRAWARSEGSDTITKERILSWLDKQEKNDKRDLEAVRDLILGRYKLNENASDYGRFARAAMAFNYIRAMGGSLLANLTEVYRPAMVHGFGSYMNDGIRPLLTNLDAVKLSVKEAQLAGQVTEMVTQNRLMSLGEVGDPYKSGTAIERLLQNGTRLASKWNGLTFWTDGMKTISSILSQHRIIDGVMGKADDTRFLAYLGIDKNMAQTIAEKFKAHGQTLDGVHIANTEKWTDGLSGNELDRAKQAVRAYRAAISKDVDSIIVTRSAADLPLFANTPTGKMLLQFRTFNMAAHQRVMLRGLQESQARFLSGMIAMTTMGMAAATMRSWRGGEERWEKFKQSASNPGYLIGEGLDMTGIFPMIFEAANTSEKFLQASGKSFNPIKTPLMAAFPNASQQGESTRFASRGVIGALAGPTAGMIETAAKAAGGNKKAAAQLLPYNSYLGPRELIQLITGDSPYGR